MLLFLWAVSVQSGMLSLNVFTVISTGAFWLVVKSCIKKEHKCFLNFNGFVLIDIKNKKSGVPQMSTWSKNMLMKNPVQQILLSFLITPKQLQQMCNVCFNSSAFSFLFFTYRKLVYFILIVLLLFTKVCLWLAAVSLWICGLGIDGIPSIPWFFSF